MMSEKRISKIAETIFQEFEGGRIALFKVQSENNSNIWYELSWNIYENDLQKAFECECTDWNFKSNKTGLCKHSIALCKKLIEERRIPDNWYNEALKIESKS